MSTLNTYRTKTTQKLGTANTNFFTPQNRDEAINEALSNTYAKYDIPELFKITDLVFVNGACSIPTDMSRVMKIWDSTNSTPIFTFVLEEGFDLLADTAAWWWTIDYDQSDDTRKIFIRPSATTAARMRYIKKIPNLVSSNDESGLSDQWDDAIAYEAASILLANSKDIEKYKVMSAEADASAARAYGLVSSIGGVKQNSRMRSVFETQNLFVNGGQI